MIVYRLKCPVCGGATDQAREENITIYMEGVSKNSTPHGKISYVLMVVSHPIQPSAGQMSAFLMDHLPELRTSDGKIGFLWETKPINSIDISALAIDTFGKEIMDESKYTYRTMHIGIDGGEAKCLVVYDL